jgi:hypothetical protein
MAHVLEFDPEEKIVRVTVSGELTDQGALELYSSVRLFTSTHDVRGGILDLSPVTSFAVGADGVRRMARNPPLFAPPIVRVIVAPGDLVFGMSRLFQISRSEVHSDLHVVHTLEEAYRVHHLTSPHFIRMPEVTGAEEQ